MTAFQTILLVVYYCLLGLFCIYGLHKYHLIYLFLRHRRNRHQPPRHYADEELPKVTVQLPCFNEMFVIERVIDAACRLRYPREKLEIQVLDDSTDESVEVARRKVAEKRAEGHNIVHLHRTNRTGFKAGALAEGMKVAHGDFFAVFDADFIPHDDFLLKTVHHFTDEKVGMVQMRWDHLNRNYNFLTKVESILLDGHFIIESTARCRSGCFFNFNGTAGIWRKEAINDGGGWEHDTLTEDLDLSYRSQMAGWRFVYLLEEGAPAEVPTGMNAFKNQQHRWAKGITQTMRKILPRIWKSDLSFIVKMEATFHLTANLAYLAMVLMLTLMLPSFLIRLSLGPAGGSMLFDVLAFILMTFSFFAFYLVSQMSGGRNWKDTLKYLPFMTALGIGLAVNNSKAVLEALFGQVSPFVRTPKYGVVGRKPAKGTLRYRAGKSLQPLVELALGAYFGVILFTAIHYRAWAGVPFTALFFAAFLYIGTLSILENFARPAPRAA